MWWSAAARVRWAGSSLRASASVVGGGLEWLGGLVVGGFVGVEVGVGARRVSSVSGSGARGRAPGVHPGPSRNPGGLEEPGPADRDQPHVQAAARRLDHHAVARVHGDVVDAAPAVGIAEEQQVAGEQRIPVDDLSWVCQYWSRDTRSSGTPDRTVRRYIRPEQSYVSGPSVGPDVRLAALGQGELQGLDRPRVGAAAGLRTGEVFRAEPAVGRALGRLGRAELAGVALERLLGGLLRGDTVLSLVYCLASSVVPSAARVCSSSASWAVIWAGSSWRAAACWSRRRRAARGRGRRARAGRGRRAGRQRRPRAPPAARRWRRRSAPGECRLGLGVSVGGGRLVVGEVAVLAELDQLVAEGGDLGAALFDLLQDRAGRGTPCEPVSVAGVVIVRAGRASPACRAAIGREPTSGTAGKAVPRAPDGRRRPGPAPGMNRAAMAAADGGRIRHGTPPRAHRACRSTATVRPHVLPVCGAYRPPLIVPL